MVEKVVSMLGPINCACVIHGDAYSWKYVETLYNMLNRHLTSGVQMHVYTEAKRFVPPHMIKHELIDWGFGGPKKAWWYKMQLFNAKHYSGPLLYLDLDVVLTKNIDWICQLPTENFWSVRDFKYLWRPTSYNVNSSIMWWDTSKFNYVWDAFQKQELFHIIRKYRGDQDYIFDAIATTERKFFDIDRIKSWRWQCVDGGYDFKNRMFLTPNTGTQIPNKTSILVFHGKPKPGDLQDPVIVQHWQ
jgi:hypothetical protein